MPIMTRRDAHLYQPSTHSMKCTKLGFSLTLCESLCVTVRLFLNVTVINRMGKSEGFAEDSSECQTTRALLTLQLY